MLILSRKVGEKIVIGGNITVVVSRVAGERVTLGLEAPANVKILRGELRPFEEDDRGNMVGAGASTGEHWSRRDRAFDYDRPSTSEDVPARRTRSIR